MKKSMGAVALALGFASAAEAQQVIYITGATSFRADIYYALRDMGLSVSAGATTGNNTFTFSGVVNNTTIGTITNGSQGVNVQVFTALTGAAEGFNTLINDLSPVYTNVSGASTTYINGADLAFSDVQQQSTPYANSGTVNELSSTDGLASSFGAGIAVEPYVWVASADANGKVNNVTPYILNDIFPAGALPLSFFDGVASDANTSVVLVGRTNDAGTRIISELCDGLPTASFDPAQGITQYAVGGITGLNAGTFTGTYEELGTGANFEGYASSSTLAKALNVRGAGYGIGYMSFNDAGSLLNGAQPINFQGVSPFIGSTWTANSTPWNIQGVENGQYYNWSYVHLFENTKVASTSFINKSFGPDLINAIEYEVVHPPAGTVQATDLIGRMNVNKGNDGGDINPGN
ncbi:MAG TPA: hypothetical protein VMR33_12425 [Candidatus Baltobacteraceae bacterium]|nr:hypothetical protein [Candidatus Baltobacteraceae bacterium]